MGWTIRDVLGEEISKKTVKKPKSGSFDSGATLEEEQTMTHIIRDENLSTGIDLLDKNLDGGFPRGSLVCVYADPAASPEVFLYQFSTERQTYYINTSRPVFAIKKDFSSLNLDFGLVNFIDVYSFYYKGIQKSDQSAENVSETHKKTMNFVLNEMKSLRKEEEVNLIIDNLNFFFDLRVEDRLKEILLNAIYSFPKDTSGLAFIYVIRDSLEMRTLKRIFDFSDVIMDILIDISGSRYVKRFGIPKIRGRTPLTDLFKFDIGEGVHLDTSKDIA